MRINFDISVCRLCLQSGNEQMCSIFSKDANNIMISKKIEFCGGIKMATNSDLPTKICKKCNTFLAISYKFRLICRNSQDYLQEFVSRNGRPRKNTTQQDDTPLKQSADADKTKANSYLPSTYKKEFLEKDVGFSPDDLYNEDNNNEGYSDESDLDNKEDVEPTKTLAMCADGTAIIETTRKQSHICEICGNTYERRYCLEAHMRRHRGEKPFECEICKKAFALNFQLTRHMRSHTGQRPYKCKYCDRTFADRSTNVKHERIHTNERPYKCETCGKTFTYSNVLKVHLMTHTGEKPYSCELCGKRFSQLHHLRAHLQTLQHQNDPMASKLLLKSEPFT